MTSSMSQNQLNQITTLLKEWNTSLFKFSQRQTMRILVLQCLQIQKVEEAQSILERRKRLLYKKLVKSMWIKGI